MIYTDKQNEAPQLFHIKSGSGCHPADRARDLRLEPELGLYRDADANNRQGTKEYPADSYGLVLWSHGTGWLPSDIYSYLRSFGQDGKNNFMEINDLASALSKYHFDFILFDACYMSCAEVTYAFRGCADYIIGSLTEILANSFLSIDNGGYVQKADVVGIATKFYTYYQSEAGTISVMKSDELDELAATCRTLFHDKTESDLFRRTR